MFILPAAASGGLALLERTALAGNVVPITWLLIAAPIVFWLIVGLIVEALRLQKIVELEPTADWPMKDAFQYVMLKCKRAINTNPKSDDYYTNVQGDIADAARQGRLTVWARECTQFQGGFRQVLQPFDKEDWGKLHVSLPTCIDATSNGARVIDYGDTKRKEYEDVQVCKAQVTTLWPKASWWEIHRDRYAIKRKEFQEQESNGNR